MWVFAVALALLSLLLFLILLPIRVRAHVEGKIAHVGLQIAVKPPLWPWYIRVPDLTKMSRRRPAKETKKQTGRGNSAARISRVTAALRESYPVFKDALSVLMRTVRFERLRVTGRAGTGDAYEAAMLCGTANAAISLFLSIARRHGARFRERPAIRFSPVFNEAYLSFLADIETSFSVLGVLRAAFLLKRLLTPQSIRSRSTLSSCKSVEY